MKKLFIFSLFLLISNSVFPQINYGFKFGIDLSLKVKSSEKTTEIPVIYGKRFGYVFGIFGTYSITEKFSIDSEILYVEKGIKKLTKRNTSITYLIIPVLFGYNPIDKLKFQIGPEIGYVINTNLSGEGIEEGNDFFVNKFDLGINVGSVFNISSNYFLSIRYSQSLIPVYSKTWIYEDFDRTINYRQILKNNTFFLTLAYLF